MSLAEACFSIFFAPSRVFAERENRDWVLPLFIVTVLVALVFFGARPYMQPAIDAETTRQMAATVRANPQLTPAQIEGARSMGEKFAFVGVTLSTPVIVVSVAILMWIIGRIVESKQTLKAAFVVATFAYFPRIFGARRRSDRDRPGPSAPHRVIQCHRRTRVLPRRLHDVIGPRGPAGPARCLHVVDDGAARNRAPRHRQGA
jgi:hypothetical protein